MDLGILNGTEMSGAEQCVSPLGTGFPGAERKCTIQGSRLVHLAWWLCCDWAGLVAELPDRVSGTGSLVQNAQHTTSRLMQRTGSLNSEP